VIDRQRWERMWGLYHAAGDRPEREQETWVRGQCGDDPELAAEILDLLRCRPPGEFLESPVIEVAPEEDSLPGTQLAQFRIETVLGAGGMGTVYLAHEEGALERPVAIKVVRRGLDTERVIQRFRAEQATLARLAHPALAPIYQAGITDDGRPWFAMEYVDGLNLIDHCRQRQVSLSKRLAMFAEVCEAVQHIHQKGIIHRDIKPSNILVRREDGAIKLIDFGVARALLDSDGPRLTRLDQPLGTPEYMSPEQCADGADPDTRSDVYALGVVLFELLTGNLPRQPDGRSGVRRLRTPSQTLEHHSASSDMQSDPRWRARLRGDIDWIVLKALAQERERRYPTAAALAEDIRHVLAHEPVKARPPSALYKLGRLIRRHPFGAFGTSLAVVTLCALTVALWMRGHQLATALERAVAERERAAQISDFMLETFSAADPHQHRGTELTARELLDQGRARAESLDADPGVLARILLTMANTYRRLGRYDEARQTAEAALATIGASTERARREIRADILTSLTTLTSDTSDYATSVEYARQALAEHRLLSGEDSLPVARRTAALGYALLKLGDFDAAEPLLERAVALHLELGVEHDEFDTFGRLARLHVDRGNLDKAEALYRESLERSRRFHGEFHPETATLENNLATLYYRTGQLSNAAHHYENALAIQRQMFDPLHPKLLTVKNNLGALYNRLGDHERAVEILEPTLAGRRDVLGEEHLEVAVTGYHLANALRGLQRDADAEVHFLQAIAIMRQAAGERNRRVGVLLNGLAEFQLERGQVKEAGTAIESALNINEAGWPTGHRTTAHSRLIAARVRLTEGRLRDSAELARLAIADLVDRPGVEEQLARARATLGLALAGLGESGPAMVELDQAIEFLSSRPGTSEQELERLSITRAGLEAKADLSR
jgi:eukaryotic-like serine/threonine-protein kinase